MEIQFQTESKPMSSNVSAILIHKKKNSLFKYKLLTASKSKPLSTNSMPMTLHHLKIFASEKNILKNHCHQINYPLTSKLISKSESFLECDE